jgi:hypothetical protein
MDDYGHSFPTFFKTFLICRQMPQRRGIPVNFSGLYFFFLIIIIIESMFTFLPLGTLLNVD